MVPVTVVRFFNICCVGSVDDHSAPGVNVSNCRPCQRPIRSRPYGVALTSIARRWCNAFWDTCVRRGRGRCRAPPTSPPVCCGASACHWGRVTPPACSPSPPPSVSTGSVTTARYVNSSADNNHLQVTNEFVVGPRSLLAMLVLRTLQQ